MTSNNSLVERIRSFIPLSYRESGYRYVAGLTMTLFAVGVLTSEEAALWTQLGVSTLTLLFAALYATTPWRLALYLTTGPLGAVLMYYGLTYETRWALIVAAVGQIFGVTTAAAKVVQLRPSEPVIAPPHGLPTAA